MNSFVSMENMVLVKPKLSDTVTIKSSEDRVSKCTTCKKLWQRQVDGEIAGATRVLTNI